MRRLGITCLVAACVWHGVQQVSTNGLGNAC